MSCRIKPTNGIKVQLPEWSWCLTLRVFHRYSIMFSWLHFHLRWFKAKWSHLWLHSLLKSGSLHTAHWRKNTLFFFINQCCFDELRLVKTRSFTGFGLLEVLDLQTQSLICRLQGVGQCIFVCVVIRVSVLEVYCMSLQYHMLLLWVCLLLLSICLWLSACLCERLWSVFE